MGWTGTWCTNTYPNGKVKVKEELDKIFTWHSLERDVSVIKSRMVGSTYYAAIRVYHKPKNEEDIIGYVVLTSQDKRSGCNFLYKEISETMGPTECKCPESILNLLSSTENERANLWRKNCHKYNEQEKERKKHDLKKLPYGTEIIAKSITGREFEVIKCEPNYQFKTYWFKIKGKNSYLPKKNIVEWRSI